MGALHEALAKAIADCGEGISKDRKAQGYNFRGIDQALNFLNPVMARHGLALVPHAVLDEQVIERTTKNGGAMYFARAKVEFRLYHVSGDFLPVMVWTEAMDTSDKALNKVMSVAWKYAAIQTFCIPVEDVADESTERQDMEPSRARERAPDPPPRDTTVPPTQFLLGDLTGTLVSEAGPGTIERYLTAVEHHIKTHPEFARDQVQAWRTHYATCKRHLQLAKEAEQKKAQSDEIPY